MSRHIGYHGEMRLYGGFEDSVAAMAFAAEMGGQVIHGGIAMYTRGPDGIERGLGLIVSGCIVSTPRSLFEEEVAELLAKILEPEPEEIVIRPPSQLPRPFPIFNWRA